MQRDIEQIVKYFCIYGDFLRARPYGSGHINDTYKVSFSQGGTCVNYILQRINHYVFKNPPEMMENIERITNHIRNKLKVINGEDVSRQVLTVVKTRENTTFYYDSEGNYWRVYYYIERATTFDSLDSLEKAFQAAQMFGDFLGMLSDLPPPLLHETIPDFHNAPVRLEEFERILKSDRLNRAKDAAFEIDFLSNNSELLTILPGLVDKGKIPIRTTHNDTKINNVLFDDDSGKGICIIDLDTVMPGLSLYDFGDLVRTTLSSAAEDERDLSQVNIDLSRFEVIVKGYLASAQRFINRTEIQHLVTGAMMMTLVIGTRFLGDFLSGDRYFKVARKEHNLDRCRVQFKLVQLMLTNEERLQQIVAQARDNGSGENDGI
jgi:hypothetical protein